MSAATPHHRNRSRGASAQHRTASTGERDLSRIVADRGWAIMQVA